MIRVLNKCDNGWVVEIYAYTVNQTTTSTTTGKLRRRARAREREREKKEEIATRRKRSFCIDIIRDKGDVYLSPARIFGWIAMQVASKYFKWIIYLIDWHSWLDCTFSQLCTRPSYTCQSISDAKFWFKTDRQIFCTTNIGMCRCWLFLFCREPAWRM